MDVTLSDAGNAIVPKPRKRRPDLAERNRSGHEHPIFPQGKESGIKHCTDCCEDKPLDEFGRDASVSDGKRAQCKRCTANAAQRRYFAQNGREKQRAAERKRRAQMRQIVDTHKDVPCVDCGGRFPAVCMDFDHVSDDKVAGISQMIHSNFGIDSILAEIAKCEVVCANCHRLRTASRGQWYGSQEERAV